MEKLNLNSELLKPMKDQLELILNRLMNAVVIGNKEAEITVKINLDSSHMGETNPEGEYVEWEEPRIDYSISEKIKETKSTNKGSVGFDYELKIDEETNEVYVQKINEQMSILEELNARKGLSKTSN